MTMNGGNRSMSERLDTSLYDKVKQFQKQFAEMVRLHIFNELLFEGGFDPIENPLETSMSDRCYFKFNEIDTDTQVKKETHIIQKYVSSLITLTEARTEMGIDPEAQMDDLFSAIQTNQQKDIIDAQAAANPPAAPSTDNKEQPAKKGSRNLPSNRKGVDNIIRPQNQSGKKTSPNIKRSDPDWINTVENLLQEQYDVKIEQSELTIQSEE